MASVSAKVNVRAIVFVKIELDGQTLRYATENINAKDTDGTEYFWEGRVQSVGTLNAGFNDFRESSSTVSSLPIVLSNGKSYSAGSTLDSLLTSYFWGLKTITIFLQQESIAPNPPTHRFVGGWHVGANQTMGPKKNVAPNTVNSTTTGTWTLLTSDIIFKGIVGFPNVYVQKEDSIQITAYDQRYSDQFLAAPNLFRLGDIEDNSTYQELGPQVEGKNVPIVYGDFTDEEQLPIYLIGGTHASLKTFKIADSATLASGQNALKSIVSINVDGTRRAATSSDLPNGTATLSDVTIVDGKVFTISCSGKTRGSAIASLFGGSASTLLEHPIEILYDLLSNRLGIANSFIDTASFTTIYNADTSVKCRRWLGSSETLVEIINDLCFDFGYGLYSLFGVFTVNQLSINGSAEKSFTPDDVREGSYSLSIDPNKSYFNSLGIRFKKNYASNNFDKLSLLKDYPKIAQHGKTFDFPLELNWSHQEIWAVERFGLLLWIVSQPIQVLNLSLEATAWDMAPTDILSLTYHIFTAQNFLVRSASKDLTDFKTDIIAWNLGILSMKNWAADAASDPTTYANAQSLTYGTWHADAVIITGFNDTIKVTTSTSATATIAAGTYSTPALLATAIQTAINAAVGTDVTVTYNSTTRKFTIATVDVSNFTLHWTDTPEIGRSILGFDVSSNSSGASTYTSAYLCLFDIVSGEAVSQWA